MICLYLFTVATMARSASSISRNVSEGSSRSATPTFRAKQGIGIRQVSRRRWQAYTKEHGVTFRKILCRENFTFH